jgi:hypothetical protein
MDHGLNSNVDQPVFTPSEIKSISLLFTTWGADEAPERFSISVVILCRGTFGPAS